MSITFMQVLEWAEDMGIQDISIIHDKIPKLLGADVSYKFERLLRSMYVETEIKPSWSTSDLIKYLTENKKVAANYIYL